MHLGYNFINADEVSDSFEEWTNYAYVHGLKSMGHLIHASFECHENANAFSLK